MSDIELKKYFRQVKKHLKCSAEYKKKCSEHFQCCVSDYLIDYPDMTLQELYNEFGLPKEVGERYLTQLSAEDIRPYQTKKRVLSAALIAALFIILFLFYSQMLWGYPDAYEINTGEIVGTTNSSDPGG